MDYLTFYIQTVTLFVCLFLQTWTVSNAYIFGDAKYLNLALVKGKVYNLTAAAPEDSEDGRVVTVWLVSAPEDFQILVHIVDFMMQNTADTLIVGEDSDLQESSEAFARFSGSFPPQSLVIPNRYGWLALHSSATSGSRLRIQLEALRTSTKLSLRVNQTVEVMSPRYPMDYPSYADIGWLIKTKRGQSVTIRFLDVDLESNYDKIMIGTGWDFTDRDTHLARISGRFNATDLTTDVFVAAEEGVWVRFQSDSSKTFRGFLLQVTAGPGIEVEFMTGLNEQNPQAIPVTPPVNLASPNYPSPYPHDQNITWFISPPPNYQIHVSVVSCYLEDKHDVVQFGSLTQTPTTALDRTERLTGSGTPRGFHVYFPVNETVWVHFQSDFSVSYQGFWLQISAVVEQTRNKIDTEREVTDAPKAPSPVANNGGIRASVISVVVVCAGLILVALLAGSYYGVKRRRPRRAEGHTMTHLYTTPDDIMPGQYESPSAARTHPAPITESDYMECIDDYDAVREGASWATPSGHDAMTSLSQPADITYLTPTVSPAKHDYAITINAEKKCASYETAGAGNDGERAGASCRPAYMTSIEKRKPKADENTYHIYTPMNGPHQASPKPVRSTAPSAVPKGASGEASAEPYVNLTQGGSSSAYLNGQTQLHHEEGVNGLYYVPMLPGQTSNDVNDAIYEVATDVADTKKKGPKPKNGKKEKRTIRNMWKRKNKYANATYGYE